MGEFEQTVAQHLGFEYQSILQPIDEELVARIPRSVAHMYEVVPLALVRAGDCERLRVAVWSPYNPSLVEELGFVLGVPVVIVVAPEDVVKAAILKYYGPSDESKAERS